MDIFGWIADNTVNAVVGGAVTLASSWAIFAGLKWAADVASNAITNYAIDAMKSVTKDSNDRRLAAEIVRWVEVKLPDAPGPEKRVAGIAAIKRAVPLISEEDAGRLVDVVVQEMNDVLKKVEVSLTTASAGGVQPENQT